MAIKVNGATAIDNSRNFYGNGSNLTGIGGGTTLVASIPLGGYGSLSATGLDLSSYKSLEIIFYNIDTVGGRQILVNESFMTANTGASSQSIICKLYLDTSVCFTNQIAAPSVGGYLTTVTNATTSLTFRTLQGYFWGVGTSRIYIYGVS